MQSKLNPYLSFRGEAREALQFYHGIFGGQLTVTTFAEGGVPAEVAPPTQLMHGMLVADNGITLMGSDAQDVGGFKHQTGSTISISLSGDNASELTAYFNGLAEGGHIAQPLTQAPWGDTFGMVSDRFGIFWMVNIVAKSA